MNPIDLTLEMMMAADKEPHCQAELGSDRPFNHWKEHCVNCGAHKTKHHLRDDCPSQHYEKEQS